MFTVVGLVAVCFNPVRACPDGCYPRLPTVLSGPFERLKRYFNSPTGWDNEDVGRIQRGSRHVLRQPRYAGEQK